MKPVSYLQMAGDGACAVVVGLPRTPRFGIDPDTALMLRFAAGDDASFDLLVERHRASVVNHLYRLVGGRDIAEELAQDVFIRVFRSRARYRPSAKFSTWLFHITTNIGLNWRRDTQREAAFRYARRVEIRDPAPRADELLVRECRAKEIQDAIRTLPSKQLAAVLLHKYEGLEYAEIAEVMGCSIQALKSLLFRAYETLRRLLGQPPESQRRSFTPSATLQRAASVTRTARSF